MRTASTVLGFVLALAACGSAQHAHEARVTSERTARTSSVARPSACVELTPSANLQASLDALPEGASACLRAGHYRAPITIERALTLWGPREAVFEASEPGTLIHVRARGTRLFGFTVDGSGGRYDMQDAAIAVRADDVTVQGVRIVHAVFGVLTDQVHRVKVLDNEISGDRSVPIGVRGDGIRLWETRDSYIAGNHVWDSRDLVVWYSPDNLIENNVLRGGRYGTHFMYSSKNLVQKNQFLGNVVGTFAMYSHDIEIVDNDYFDCRAAGGMGVGIKDSGNISVHDNRFMRNRTGVFVDNSPSTVGERDVVEHNRLYGNDAAMVFHGAALGNFVHENDFRSNREQVLVEGGTDARDATWQGNRFDDYVGYDLDDDGRGDVPYELRSLANSLASRTPDISLFRGTLAFGVLDALGRIVPLFAPKTILVDATPSLVDPITEASDAR